MQLITTKFCCLGIKLACKGPAVGSAAPAEVCGILQLCYLQLGCTSLLGFPSQAPKFPFTPLPTQFLFVFTDYFFPLNK